MSNTDSNTADGLGFGPRSGAALRERFVDFFTERLGIELPSSSLVPRNDSTVLLTTAGMQQMVPFFLGAEEPPAPRLCSVQKCFRTVDIDEVGDASHLTFFEMLGNFSVGDYFKDGAIRFAWEFLTRELGIPADRLQVTVFPSDDEARGLWRDAIGLAPERIVDDETNWWGPVGPTGPCGPDSEIYVDRGPEYGCGEPDCGPACEWCDRFLEVWNLVFMQFYRDENGVDTPLPRRNIDTGMGLERLAMIIQGVGSVYDTDLYQPIIRRAEVLTGARYGGDERTDRALRVLADHSRAVVFLIADGVLPANEGRGYILRRILRRAVRYGRLLGRERPFLTETAATVIDLMGDRYPELRERRDYIFRIVRHEEEAFGRTLAVGLQRFETLAAGVKAEGRTTIPGAEVFRLYDTYGFPFDLTMELAREHGLEIARDEFDQAMDRQREESRRGSRFGQESRRDLEIYAGLRLPATEFLGYDLERSGGEVLAIVGAGGTSVAEARVGEEVEIILDRTPFYAEAGGQVGDQGEIVAGEGRFRVRDTQRPVTGLTGHRGVVEAGGIRVGDVVEAAIDAARRADIRRNHTATHLLHRALRLVVGPHAQQAGSLVAPDRLRFDFTHLQALTPDELRRVGEIANAAILENDAVYAETMGRDEALATGAMALFGEKYGDQVRVVTIEDFSKELCGGTHVAATGEIGPVVVTGESSVASGVRRIEALTGRVALAYLNQLQGVAGALSSGLRAPVAELPAQVEGLRGRIRELEREIERLRGDLAGGQAGALLERAQPVDGVPVLAARVEAADGGALGQLGDRLRDRLGAGVIFLGAVVGGRPALLAIVTPDLVTRGLSAGALLKATAERLGGRGGGRPDRAQGGGGDPARLDEALAAVPALVQRGLRAED
ncbi:MAG: Alanyl-tRNA synthetase [uncultured Thermomicrobiales bacterium]|uniref:Alanine--tRNA ligase n=1 Tax=uncultured Thermomicrobiales bacterium TaxID=1645740 RepID=A0A6J4VEP8_9BACT|nr:MAG: Alanyl-tRNA synthetase [uncultured Thermomicrobiales bacterium]